LLAETHLNLNEPQEAFHIYSKIESLDPNDLEARIRLASIYFIGNRLDEGHERVETILEKNPDHIEALYVQAAILTRERKDPKPVKNIYQSIIAIDPTQIKAYMALSRIQMGLKEYDEAKTS
jgi:tetratricopeptide (TPR) repeat protein